MAEVKEMIVMTPGREILFKSSTLSEHNVSKLILQNKSTEKGIAFKIKTTAPKNYIVKPNQGIIDLESTTTIDITYCPSEVSRELLTTID